MNVSKNIQNNENVNHYTILLEIHIISIFHIINHKQCVIFEIYLYSVKVF